MNYKGLPEYVEEWYQLDPLTKKRPRERKSCSKKKGVVWSSTHGIKRDWDDDCKENGGHPGVTGRLWFDFAGRI